MISKIIFFQSHFKNCLATSKSVELLIKALSVILLELIIVL
nr:MAG TPA: hypothetical protein [Bacteriophage sp.]